MADVSIIVDPTGKWSTNESNSGSLVQFELTALNDAGLQDWLTAIKPVADRVKGISITHTTLAPSNIMKLLSVVLQDRVFRNLTILDLSYCSIPEMAVNMLCEYVNPFTGGYNITFLNATRCKLGYYGTTKLIEALYANSTLEEILLTGNNCTDKAIPYLHTALTKYKNKLESIGLGSNKLTNTGLVQLCTMLEHPGRPLKRLLLENNPDIGDAHLDDLVVALNKGNAIETLSLSACGIGSCEWARFLPFMNTLHSLNLSYNLIGDDEFGKLCKALERCYCLKHLDLAYNRFCGTNCNVVEQMVATNGALHFLSLRGNRCVDSVWDALHRGMLLNQTMLQLNLSDCNITVQNVGKICKLFEHNDICTIDFSNNPLPPEFINSPRDHVSLVNKAVSKSKAGTVVTDRERDLPVLSHNDRAHVLSMSRSAEWCSARATEVSLSLNSLCIVSDRQHLLVKPDDAPSNSSTSIIGLPVMAHSQLSSAVSTTAQPPRAPQALTSPDTIAQSELYLSPTALREFVAESDLANTTERRVVHVAYGRAALVIGHIEITSLTTFAEAQLLVHPLVEEYVSTIAANPEVHRDLVSKYSLMDAVGLTLTKTDAELRRVWPEFCAQAEPVIVVRPGNWVRLQN